MKLVKFHQGEEERKFCDRQTLGYQQTVHPMGPVLRNYPTDDFFRFGINDIFNPIHVLLTIIPKGYNLANFYLNSNFDIAGNCTEGSSVLFII